ncbi:MAG: CDP-alcohol phosphatidyltransferase family protein [bacterium]|nr:MAG: CDP-alcohol phosphatidyltransferase family protein [bacterium]
MPGRNKLRNWFRGLLDPVVGILASLGVTPFAVTVTGAILSLFGAVLVATGSLAWGGVVLIVSGICDTLDGSLARRENKVTSFGAFIDSTIDRVTEIAYLGALVFYFIGQGSDYRIVVFFVLLALAGSFLTSYTRARAEGLGVECKVGWLERPERVTLLVLGLLFGRIILIIVILALAVLTIYTFIQRVLHVRRLTLGRNP